MMGNSVAFVANLRPRQWTKNLVLLAGIIFARKLGHPPCLVRAVLGMAVFCLASGTIYVFNDIADLELDRLHPDKKNRPLASGDLSVEVARRWAGMLGGVSLVAAGLLGWQFFAGVVFFISWNGLYTRWLKRVPVLDVVGIGLSFVVRAVSGVLVLLPAVPDVSISLWLLVCTFFLSLFLGFCKRRDEFLKIDQGDGLTRPVLSEYTEPLLNTLIGGATGLTAMAYALYTVWPSTVAQFGTRNLIYTLPFVLMGMGRYLYLVFSEDRGGRPHEILLMDLRLQLAVVAWAVTAVMIIGV